MAQKKPNKPTPQNTVITVILPEENTLVRTGQIVVQRGNLAKVGQFEYTSLDDIMQAIQTSAEDLIALEQNPPPKLAPMPITATPAQATASVPSTDGQDEDESAEDEPDSEVEADPDTSTAPEETAAEETAAPVPAAGAQPTLL